MDQIARDNEEDVDPDEAAAEAAEAGMGENNREHRDRAEPVDIGAVARTEDWPRSERSPHLLCNRHAPGALPTYVREHIPSRPIMKFP